MKRIFDGKCKDCEFGVLRKDPDYIACQLGGIREPEQTCNILDKPGVRETTSDQDKWITKEQAKELARKHVAHGMLEPLIWDIDALEPIAEVQDAVSREAVSEWLRLHLLDYIDHLQGGIQIRLVDVMNRMKEDLPPVLPVAESRRSEEEIRATIDWLTTNAQKEEERSHEGPFGPGRIEVDICDHRSRVFKNCVSFYNWTQGEENEWSKTFAPSGSNQGKGKEETGGKD